MVEIVEENKDSAKEDRNELEELHELREYLRFLLNKPMLEELINLADLIDKSYVDSYMRIKENSEYGKDCGYARKALDLYDRLQSKSIGNKIKFIYETYIKER
jgi:hypothetical protein